MNEKVLNEARLLIAGFLKNRRLELGLTQKEVAEHKTSSEIQNLKFR